MVEILKVFLSLVQDELCMFPQIGNNYANYLHIVTQDLSLSIFLYISIRDLAPVISLWFLLFSLYTVVYFVYLFVYLSVYRAGYSIQPNHWIHAWIYVYCYINSYAFMPNSHGAFEFCHGISLFIHHTEFFKATSWTIYTKLITQMNHLFTGQSILFWPRCLLSPR